jgi:hypothetical protein
MQFSDFKRGNMLPTLNRAAVALRPKRPFLEWASKAKPESPSTPADVAEAFRERTVFLIPEFETSERATEILGDWAELLFEEMLEAWSLDIGAWPKGREWEVFKEWFEIEFFSVVVDTFEEPLAQNE